MYGLNTVEKRKEARKIYLEGMDVKEYPELNCVIGIKTEPYLCAVAFSGTKGKPAFNYTFETLEQMNKYISDFLESQKKRVEYKAEQKKKNKGVLTGAAACAAAIRKELKAKYPGVKFSVTSETFSMGKSVSVNWTDGPEYTEIESIVGCYKAGDFNGMTDMYEYKEDCDPDKPSAKYIEVNKEFSDEAIKALRDRAEELGILYRFINNRNEFIPQLAERVIREELQRREREEKEQQQPNNIIQIDFINRKVVRL